MALTVTNAAGRPESMGSKRFAILELAFDDSYSEDGEPLTPVEVGFATFDFVLIEPAGGYTFEYDHVNEKVIARYQDYDAVADGPSIEVPDTTDLEAVVGVRCFVIGTT